MAFALQLQIIQKVNNIMANNTYKTNNGEFEYDEPYSKDFVYFEALDFFDVTIVNNDETLKLTSASTSNKQKNNDSDYIISTKRNIN